MSRPQRIKKMSLSKALDKYHATVSVHKRGHKQESIVSTLFSGILWLGR